MTITCLKCNHTAEVAGLSCPKCGAVYAKLQEAVARGELIRSIPERPAAAPVPAMRPRTSAELLAYARETGQWSQVPPEIVQAEAASVQLTTTDMLPGHHIEEVRGIVVADFAYAFGAIYEAIAGFFRNLAGSGKSSDTVNFLTLGRLEGMQALRYQALDRGANAVVGVKFEYEEFSGANQRGILLVSCSGTAVRARKNEN